MQLFNAGCTTPTLYAGANWTICILYKKKPLSIRKKRFFVIGRSSKMDVQKVWELLWDPQKMGPGYQIKLEGSFFSCLGFLLSPLATLEHLRKWGWNEKTMITLWTSTWDRCPMVDGNKRDFPYSNHKSLDLAWNTFKKDRMIGSNHDEQV